MGLGGKVSDSAYSEPRFSWLALMKLVFAAPFHHCLSEAEALRGAARKLHSAGTP